MWIDSLKSFYFGYQSGEWKTCGSTPSSCSRVLQTSDGLQEVVLRFGATSKTVSVTFASGFTTVISLPESFYSKDSVLRVQIQTAPGSRVTIPKLYLSVPPSGKVTNP